MTVPEGMARPMTVTTHLELEELLDGAKTRGELGATPYAMQLAEDDGVIARAGRRGNATLWKLTPKGRRRAGRR